ncbi:MAG: hypothetical protein HUJ77_12645 [Clostridium sp.]|uniref:hypothetical protein n=1 Tax=Clostridium sp. TaxID=1506 RepID=UPI0025BFC0CE|nr:hypothetical protein [Clostridium sp.]MCF0149231.1 hypothetical protein [Clostridium sp.]
MKDERISLVLKSIIWGTGWLALAALIGFIITKVTEYKSFENVLFIEGLILIFVGIFASISGDPMGLSLQGLGQNNAQYLASANLEVSKMEKQKSNMKINISFALSTFSLLIGGILAAIVTFVM